MAANRYGRIYHSDHHYINLRFPSVDARREFAKKFEAYHASHDHDGEAPRFEDTASSVIGNPESNTIHDAHSVSIDGYATYEIEAYHNPSRWNTYDRGRYRPPTCCVAPTIAINRTFIDSSTLTRHELSAIFMDMPEEDFQNLLKSVERDGFKDPVIRMIDEQVLDGWHRYRAAKELNLLRKLRFQQWDEKDEGDPAAFVLARNIERRHLNPAQRAQIVVRFNERAGAGNPNLTSPNGEVKTREQLAKEASVGTSTIDRAAKVEKAGRGDEVIAGESAGKIITEETLKSLWEQVNPAISAWKEARDGVGYASKTMFIKAALRWEGLESHTVVDVKVLKILLDLLTTTETNILEELIRKQLDGKSLWADPEEELAEKRKLALEAEHRMFNALDEVAPDWDSDDFIKAACDKHSDWEAIEFPDLDYTDIPDVWEERYNLLHAEITEPAAWIQEMLDKMAGVPTESESEPQETEAEVSHHDDSDREGESHEETSSLSPRTSATQPKQTAEEREANKLLKQKKQVIKSIWDMRIQAARDYTSDADTELNLNLTLPELEKGFIKHEAHAYCADAFRSALQRTSETSFNICLEKTLAADVSLEALEAEYKALSTYAIDILAYQKQEWIQELIAKKRKKAAAKAETEAEVEPDTEGLSKAFRQIFTLHARFDRDIVDCEALGETYHLHVDDVEASMDDFQRELAALEHAARKHLEADADLSVEEIANRVEVDDIEVVKTVIAKIQLDEKEGMEALWEAFNKRFPKWKAKYADSGYKENDLIQGATEAELFDALRLYRDSDRTGPVTAEEIQEVTDLMKSQSYPFARRVREVLRDKQAEELSDIGRLFAENQLSVIRNAVSPLLDRLGADAIAHHHKEGLTADLYDVFLQYENVPTEKEMIVALLDVVDSILAEEIEDGRFDTLDNEVLCPDDEVSDRQAMNSDLVTEVEE